MRSLLYSLIVGLIAVTVVDASRAQVIQVVSPTAYAAPTNYVATVGVRCTNDSLLRGGNVLVYNAAVCHELWLRAFNHSRPYSPYQTWAAPRPFFYGAMRPVTPVRVYGW